MNRDEEKRRQNPFLADSVQRNAANNGVTELFHGARGHGFAAEQANDLYDNRGFGTCSEVVGGDNKKNGADRMVNGVSVQSKYCATGSRCVQECFHNGKFRYYADGKPMQIEVPSDLYEDAVKAMERRIAKGEVDGVSNPKQARNIIRKGHFTYEQARNIARAGTVEGVAYDAATGMVAAAPGASVTGLVTFANACMNGCDPKEALLIAGKSVGKVFGQNMMISAVAGQATRLGANAALRPIAQTVVRSAGSTGASLLATAAGRAGLSGAAAQSVATKFLTSNAVTGAATTLVLSTGDLIDIFRGRMTAGEFAKNFAHRGAGVAGGIAGMNAGAATGAAIGSVIPVVGTAAGGIIGGLLGSVVGGSAGSSGMRALTSALSDDDPSETYTVDVMDVLEGAFQYKGQQYALTRAEAEEVACALQTRMTPVFLDSLAHTNLCRSRANALMDELMVPIVQRRAQAQISQSEVTRQEGSPMFGFGSKKEQPLPTSAELLEEVLATIQHAAAQNKITPAEAAEQLSGANLVVNAMFKPYLDMAQGRDVEEIARELQEFMAAHADEIDRMSTEPAYTPAPQQRVGNSQELDLLRKFIGS